MNKRIKKKNSAFLGKDNIWPVGILAVILVFAGLVFVLNMPQEELVFNFAENQGFWRASAGTGVSLVDDVLQLEKGPGELYVVIPALNLDAARYDVGVIELEQPVAFDTGRLLFLSPFNKGFDFNIRFDFDTGRANRNNKIYLDLAKHSAWQGVIKGVLLIPGKDPTKVKLKSVRFIQANLGSKIRAWWGDFAYYHDPKLNSCNAMATPVFMGRGFNDRFVPILWGLLVFFVLAAITIHFTPFNPAAGKVPIIIFFVIIIGLWGLLDLRNNLYYLKAIHRNVNLYWGKTLQEKRGIVVGSKEFIDFMRFCDESIPLDGRIFNHVRQYVPGTPSDYLSTVQIYYNLRRRFYEPTSVKLPKPYYIFYLPEQSEIKVIKQEQLAFYEYLNLASGEKLQQEIRLWHPAKNLGWIHLWLKAKEIDKNSVEVLLLDEERNKIIGQAEYLQRFGREAVFRFHPKLDYARNQKVLLQIKNKGKSQLGIGYYYGEQYGEGKMIRNGKPQNSDMTFRLVYLAKGLKLFKRFSDDAYILTQ